MTHAEDLIDRAWDAKTDKTRLKLARQAIAIDPDSLDGYAIIAQSLGDTMERLPVLRDGAARGKILWATEMKAPSRHHFWLDIDTRPFMRVLHFLALTLWGAGAHDEAVKEAKTLLRLNPNDNQGIRELLHIWYPATGDWDALTKLLRRYRSDWSVSHLYTSWLLGFRSGNATATQSAEALEANPYVPAILADPNAVVVDDDDDLEMRGYVLSGSNAEAAAYADFSRSVWQSVPGAIEALTIAASPISASVSTSA
jgi:tetratricopeptide (TPR) repeat protein